MADDFTMGSDPEFMLVRNGVYTSAIGVVPGTKEKRYRIGNDSCYYDNVLAECTISPATTAAQAVQNIGTTLRKLASVVHPNQLIIQASANYNANQLMHPDARKIGCVPESCAYAMKEMRPPSQKIQNSNLRSAGGHIHIGSKVAQSELPRYAVVRMLDLFLGLPSIFIDRDPTSTKRKELYGKAGRYRKTSYGVEYRSLGNFWLASPRLVEFTFNVCNYTLDFVAANRQEAFWTVDMKRLDDPNAWNTPGFSVASCFDNHGYDVAGFRKALDTGNRTEAQKFIPLLKKHISPELFAEFETLCSYNPAPFYTEWKING